LDGQEENARRLLRQARRAAAFTGAGVSTGSGIPDFRSPGGIWSRYRPVSFDEFLASDDGRRRYWRYKRETFAAFRDARPNAAHRALADLEGQGRLLAVVTQNIDGLHQDAGSRRVVELHGSNRRVECLQCGRGFPAEEVMAWPDVPSCDACGGWLKPATISFGQALRPQVLDEAFAVARECDLMLVLGSSLAVYPAAAVPEAALQRGIPLVVVNRDPTPLDGHAAAVVQGAVEDVLPALVVAEDPRP